MRSYRHWFALFSVGWFLAILLFFAAPLSSPVNAQESVSYGEEPPPDSPPPEEGENHPLPPNLSDEENEGAIPEPPPLAPEGEIPESPPPPSSGEEVPPPPPPEGGTTPSEDSEPVQVVRQFFNSIRDFQPQPFFDSYSIPEMVRHFFGRRLEKMNGRARELFSGNLKAFMRGAFWGTCMGLKFKFGDFAYSIASEKEGEGDGPHQVQVKVINGNSGQTQELQCLLRKKNNRWKIINISGEIENWVVNLLDTMRTNREEIEDIFEVFIPTKSWDNALRAGRVNLPLPRRWQFIEQKGDRIFAKHPAGVIMEFGFLTSSNGNPAGDYSRSLHQAKRREDGTSSIFRTLDLMGGKTEQIWCREGGGEGGETFSIHLLLKKGAGAGVAILTSPHFELLADVTASAYMVLNRISMGQVVETASTTKKL